VVTDTICGDDGADEKPKLIGGRSGAIAPSGTPRKWPSIAVIDRDRRTP
jgi:hypothetical protein